MSRGHARLLPNLNHAAIPSNIKVPSSPELVIPTTIKTGESPPVEQARTLGWLILLPHPTIFKVLIAAADK
jgi:hypothetical protein